VVAEIALLEGALLEWWQNVGQLVKIVLLSDGLDEAFTEAAAHLDGEAYGCL
jgi:Flp pilus assembly pilin Flp